jgi:hypothetical protein
MIYIVPTFAKMDHILSKASYGSIVNTASLPRTIVPFCIEPNLIVFKLILVIMIKQTPH